MGTAVEWHDFYIAGIAASLVWPQVFFSSKDPATSLLLSLISYGISFVSRLTAAILFGRFGDKLGRKATLIWTLFLLCWTH